MNRLNRLNAVFAQTVSNNYGAITLGQLIDTLEKADPAAIVWDGFGEPGSWRGYYEFLRFEPRANVTIASMLEHAKSAVGAIFEGYKGGTYTMSRSTPCFTACYDECSDDDAITPHRIKKMIGVDVAENRETELPKRPHIAEMHVCVEDEWCVVIPDQTWDAFKEYVCALEAIAAKREGI